MIDLGIETGHTSNLAASLSDSMLETRKQVGPGISREIRGPGKSVAHVPSASFGLPRFVSDAFGRRPQEESLAQDQSRGGNREGFLWAP